MSEIMSSRGARNLRVESGEVEKYKSQTTFTLIPPTNRTSITLIHPTHYPEMRASFTIFVLIVSAAVGAFASPVIERGGLNFVSCSYPS